MAQKQPKKGSALEWAIVAAVVVIIGCIGCGIIAMLFGETTEQTAQAPTSAPAPTATPRPASATPEPELPAADDATPEAAPEPTQPPEPTPEPPTATPEPTQPGIGQDVIVDDEVRWQVVTFDEMGNTLASENILGSDIATSGRYVRVTAETENLTNEAHFIDAAIIIDDQGREFEHIGAMAAISQIPENEHCALREANPSVPLRCTWFYEVPAQATGLTLAVKNYAAFLGGGQAFIALQ
jgi:hypothetical protein